jgi:hypothetical protein
MFAVGGGGGKRNALSSNGFWNTLLKETHFST